MVLVRGLELGEDRDESRVGGELGGVDFLPQIMGLLAQGVLLIGGGRSGSLEGLELLFQAVLVRFEGRVARDGGGHRPF